MNTETIKSTEVLAPTTERISGSEAVIKCLLAEGVDILYGYPGGAIMPVYDELYIRDEFKKLLQGRKDVYLVAHSASATRFYREHYNSSRVIRLVNATSVVYNRPKYTNGSSAMSKETFGKLCNKVENAIGEFIPWDCEWFGDVDVFLSNMEKLYARLGYKDFLVAEPHIKKYYKHWAKIVYMVL